MRKSELKAKTDAVIKENQEAMQEMYDGLSNTQKKKMEKKQAVKKLLDRHKVKREV